MFLLLTAVLMGLQEEIPETQDHFLFRCPAYTIPRKRMLISLRQKEITDPTWKTLLGEGEDKRKRMSILNILITFLKAADRFRTL